MNTLREKWLVALPIIWGFISVVILIYLIVWGTNRLFTDERTVNEILESRYKSCIKHTTVQNLSNCEIILIQPTLSPER